jgi:glyoxylase I family protein
MTKEDTAMGTNAKIGGGGFHHVALKVRDFDATLKFYVDGLGCTEALQWGEGDSRGALLDSGDGNYMEIFAGGSKEIKPDSAIIHFAFRSDDVDAAIEAARAAGAEITVEPKDGAFSTNPPVPIRIAFCKGPDGEVIEFFQTTGDRKL